MSEQRKKLEARRDELQEKINTAPHWGASLSLAYEELQGVLRSLEALPATAEEPKKASKVEKVTEAPSAS